MTTLSTGGWTVSELALRLGPMPLERIRFNPVPGTATEHDVLAIREREGRLYELTGGILVEKAMGFRESVLAAALIGFLRAFVKPRGLGVVTSSDGLMRLDRGLVRIPDVAFVSWAQFPTRQVPNDPIPNAYPDLAIEILSPTNTAAEMASKRRDYFHAGTRLVWEIDPEKRTAAVFSSPEDSVVLTAQEKLDGGDVLPGFSLELKLLFAELDVQP